MFLLYPLLLIKYLTQNNLNEEWAHCGSQFKGTVHHGKEVNETRNKISLRPEHEIVLLLQKAPRRTETCNLK